MSAGFLSELQRRNVVRVGGLYLVAAWLIVQVAGTLLPAFETPAWVMKTLVGLLAVGFVPALAFAWAFELTPQGLKRDAGVAAADSIAPYPKGTSSGAHLEGASFGAYPKGTSSGAHLEGASFGAYPKGTSFGAQTARRIDRMMIVLLLVALTYFSVDKFVLAPRREAALVAALATQDTATTKPPAVADKSIAVLPFENLSEDKANGYFADGIQDQILTGLAKIGELKVISRTSTQKYASRPENLSQIARELGVAHILEGSVQRDGNMVRINVQLIRAASDSHLWADTYDRTLDNVFAVESEVAQKIADSLAANLNRGERASLAERPTGVPAAYDAYLKARALLFHSLETRAQADEILAAFRAAVRLDPKFALAWAQLAQESFRTTWIGLDNTGELRAEGEQALARASELAPGATPVELARGVHMYYIERDFAGALAIMNSLKPKLPNDADVWMWAGYLSRRLGLWPESIADFERARDLSPNDANIAYHFGVTYVSSGDCDRGLRELDASLALAPDNTHALAMKLQCAWARGDLAQANTYLAAADAASPAVQGLHGTQLLYEHDYAAAAQELQRAIAAVGDRSIDASMAGYLPARVEWQLFLALSQQRLGATAKAQAGYRQVQAEATAALAAKPANRYVETGWHLALGIAQAGLGEREAAAEQGRIAVALVPESADRLEGPAWTIYQARIYALNGDAGNAVPLLRHILQTPASQMSAQNLRFEPFWDALRRDPGFQALLEAAPAP
jgi:TolB-like protein